MWWLVGAAAAVVVLAVAGTFVYFHVISGPAPAPLGLKRSSGPSSTASAGDSAATPVAGTWKITNGSVVGYRVKEVLFGQNHTAVGRTSAITGRRHDQRHERDRGRFHRADGHDQERRERA